MGKCFCVSILLYGLLFFQFHFDSSVEIYLIEFSIKCAAGIDAVCFNRMRFSPFRLTRSLRLILYRNSQSDHEYNVQINFRQRNEFPRSTHEQGRQLKRIGNFLFYFKWYIRKWMAEKIDDKQEKKV